MTPLTIAAVNLRRTVRERINAFFLVLFPFLMILVVGLAFGGQSQPRLAVVSPPAAPLAHALTAQLRATGGVDTQAYGDRADAVRAVEEGRVEAAVILAPSYDERVAAGRPATVEYLSRADRSAQQVGMIVMAAVDHQAARLRVARTLHDRLGGSVAGQLAHADAVAAAVPRISVDTTTAGTATFPKQLGRFDTGASGMLLLFIFITSMTSATALIETRRLGITRRMYATPTRVSGIVAGEALGRIAVAVLQGLIIMVGAAVLFRVSWGDPLAAATLMLLFAVVAGSAGMLVGAVCNNTQQAIATGLLVGLGLSALGGSMMPLELFSPTMLTVAHLTPHAWAADAFATLVRHHGGFADILPELGVLVGYAAVLFLVGSWFLRRRILRG